MEMRLEQKGEKTITTKIIKNRSTLYFRNFYLAYLLVKKSHDLSCDTNLTMSGVNFMYINSLSF